jgi:hypothetical protein
MLSLPSRPVARKAGLHGRSVWLAICAAGAVVGYVAVYFALHTGKPAPAPEPEAPAAAAPAEPVVLAHVVDVTDLEPLLDPPPRGQPVGAPFEEPAEPLTPTAAPAPIAPAN